MPETLDVVPEFSLGESSLRAGLSTPRNSGVVHRRQTWTGELRRWSLRWQNASDAHVARLRDIWRKSFYGALHILWTPPGESQGTYRIASPDLVVSQNSHTSYSVQLELEEVL